MRNRKPRVTSCDTTRNAQACAHRRHTSMPFLPIPSTMPPATGAMPSPAAGPSQDPVSLPRVSTFRSNPQKIVRMNTSTDANRAPARLDAEGIAVELSMLRGLCLHQTHLLAHVLDAISLSHHLLLTRKQQVEAQRKWYREHGPEDSDGMPMSRSCKGVVRTPSIASDRS